MKYELKTCSVCGTHVMGEKSSSRAYCHVCGKFVDTEREFKWKFQQHCLDQQH